MIYNSLNNLEENILVIDSGCVGFPEGIKTKDRDMMKKNVNYWSALNSISPIKKPPNKYKKRKKDYQGHFMPSSGRSSTNNSRPTPPSIDSYGNWI